MIQGIYQTIMPGAFNAIIFFDHLMKDFSSKYKELSIVGEGTFGRVFKGKDQDNKFIAIKQIKFEEGCQGIPSSALREMTALKTLSGHPNIIQMKDKYYQPKEKNLKIIFDFYDYDLKKFINTNDSILEPVIKKIIKQIISGVCYCHMKKILHRDLKPQNILLDSVGNVKLADFGLARVLLLPLKTLTQEVQTLWYRAPQVLLGNSKYSFGVDMWAVGCIFAQLYLKRPLFFGSGYEIEQIFKIFQIMGTPTLGYWQQVKGFPDFKKTFPKWPKQSFQKMIPEMPKLALNLLESMLQMNPEKRISAAEALEHEYFKDAQA